MLYAWATPAFTQGSPVDHTWVTTYDNQAHHYSNAAAVAAAGKDYWFCWGSYHRAGGVPGNPTGSLGSQTGSVALARCLVQSNADSRTVPAARGTIFVYGVDGVCHQLANQVLYATHGSRLTVKNARGYGASTFLYGMYGLQHAAWTARIAGCTALVAARPVAAAVVGGGLPGAVDALGAALGVLGMPGMKDDFEERAREVLGRDNPELLARLLVLRTEVNVYLAQKIPGTQPPGPVTLNARNQHLLDEAARLLGPELFERIFGFPAGETINLVDPAVVMPPAEALPE